MSNISFILKRPESEYTSIFLLFTCYDGRLKYYTGEEANTKKWPKVDEGTDAVLARIKKTVRELVTDYKIKGEPLTKAVVTTSLDAILHKKKLSSSNYFDAMRSVVDKMESGKILTPKTKKRYSVGSIKTFRFTVDFLERFQPGMSSKSVSLKTYEDFIVWCQEQDYSINYIGSQIKNWKTLGKSVGGNPVYDDPAFKKIQEDAFDVYLDEKELDNMYRLKLNAKTDEVRDWFIIDAFTGLRVCDLTLLGEKNYSRKTIIIANEKTDTKVIIPVHKYIREIRMKWKGFPPAVTSHEINIYIKSIARSAGITKTVLHTITKGGKRVDTYMAKCDMISNHTARRSFITNLRKSGIADSIIMKLAGIKSAATLLKYDKLSPDEAAKIAAGTKFFK